MVGKGYLPLFVLISPTINFGKCLPGPQIKLSAGNWSSASPRGTDRCDWQALGCLQTPAGTARRKESWCPGDARRPHQAQGGTENSQHLAVALKSLPSFPREPSFPATCSSYRSDPDMAMAFCKCSDSNSVDHRGRGSPRTQLRRDPEDSQLLLCVPASCPLSPSVHTMCLSVYTSMHTCTCTHTPSCAVTHMQHHLTHSHTHTVVYTPHTGAHVVVHTPPHVLRCTRSSHSTPILAHAPWSRCKQGGWPVSSTLILARSWPPSQCTERQAVGRQAPREAVVSGWCTVCRWLLQNPLEGSKQLCQTVSDLPAAWP